MYVRVCHTQECQFAHVTELMSRNSYVMCTDTGEYWMPSLAASNGGQGRTALLGNGGRVGPPQRTHFAESSTERSRRFVALRKRSQGTVELS